MPRACTILGSIAVALLALILARLLVEPIRVARNRVIEEELAQCRQLDHLWMLEEQRGDGADGGAP